MILFAVCFFFQAEDGIRDRNVTGVQTCALPICGRNTICSLYLAKSSPNDSTRFFDNENAVADANLTTPASIKSKIPSCRTSEYTSISLNCESFIPLNTAFATEPTSD